MPKFAINPRFSRVKWAQPVLWIAACVTLAAVPAQSSAITLGGATSGFFGTSSAEYDVASGQLTSLRVGEREHLGVGGIGYYLRINDTHEVAIRPGAVLPDGLGTLQLTDTNVQQNLITGVNNLVQVSYTVPGLFTEILLTHTLESTGAGVVGQTQAASLNSSLRLTSDTTRQTRFDVTVFQYENYDLNGDTNPDETFTVDVDTANDDEVTGIDQFDGTTSVSSKVGGGLSGLPGAPFAPLSANGLDVDQASSLLASLNDNAATSTSGVRDGTGDFAHLFAFEDTLIPIENEPQAITSFASTRRIEAEVIPEPVTGATMALSVLALCNFLTKRSCRRRAASL